MQDSLLTRSRPAILVNNRWERLMKKQLVILALSLTAFAAPAQAGSAVANVVQVTSFGNNSSTISQSALNIAAVVSINGPPVTVTQNGARNYAGVIQAGVNPSATVRQTGTVVNSAGIGQSGRNMVANVSQFGHGRASNFAVIAQHRRH